MKVRLTGGLDPFDAKLINLENGENLFTKFSIQSLVLEMTPQGNRFLMVSIPRTTEIDVVGELENEIITLEEAIKRNES